MDSIRLESISYRYPEAQEHSRPWALEQLTLRASAGEMLLVMGASGAGKTTLAKILNRSIPSFHGGTLEGEVWIAGERMTHHGVAELAGIVGLVSQDFEAQLFATNVAQEIVFGLEQAGTPRSEMDGRMKRALDLVGLEGFESRDPTTLSGGEKQRLAIAAMLALEPKILVFDEPTTDLDPVGKQEIFAALSAMRRHGYTLIVIEHEIAAAEHADRLILLEDGKIIADEAPAILLAQPDLLESHGIRPTDAARLGVRMGLEVVPTSMEAAVAVLQRRATQMSPSVEASGVGSTAPRDGVPIVELADVDFWYQEGKPVLQGINLRVTAGEFIALMGENGSGKTTLAKHLNELLKPTRGRVALDRPGQGSEVQRTAATVGYVFQNPDSQIFASTVADEVSFGPRNLGCTPEEVDARVRAALAAVGLEGWEQNDPFLLARGERQRLAVASVLALQPRLLVLDEPTTGLDYREQKMMMDLLDQLRRSGTAIVIITHSPWIASEYAERGVLIEEGRVAFDGPLAELLEKDDLLERAHFVVPEIRRIAKRLGVTGASIEAVAAQLQPIQP